MLLASSFAQAQNSALTFDGVNDYVEFSNTAYDARNIRTMECWVKFNDLTGDQEIISKSTINQGIELLIYNNNLVAYCMNGSTVVSHIDYPVSSLSTGVWYHFAFSWDGTKENMRLYVNGKSVSAPVHTGNINLVGVSNPGTLRLGDWSEPTAVRRYLKGTLDEVRIWSTPRSAADIKAGMYAATDINATGLIAYFNFNEAVGTTVGNSSAFAPAGGNGTLTNGPAWFANSPVQYSNNALAFDGVNDYVIAPANTAYDFATGTVECRVKPNTLTGNVAMVANRLGATTRYSFHMSSSAILMWDGSTLRSLPFTATPGQWYHVAFVCKTATATDVYVDGNLLGTIPGGVGTATGLPLHIGYSSTGEPFNGAIDEVRIWNTVRSQSEIRSAVNASLLGNEAGLVGLFSFNQGIASGANAGVIAAIDGTATNNHGTLTNFTLTGTSSNFAAGATAIVVLPVTGLSFNAEKAGNTVNLTWQTLTETNTEAFGVERSADGQRFATIGHVQAAGQSSTPRQYSFNDGQPLAKTAYYRLKQTDKEGKATYSAVVRVKAASEAGVSISINPMPVRSTMKVSVTGLSGQGTFTIRDLNGKKLKSIAVSEGDTQVTLDRAGMPAGMFFFTLTNAKNEVVQTGKLLAD